MSACVHCCTVWWGQLTFSVCVADIRLTCWAGPSGSILWLGGSVAVLLATFAARGAGSADVHFADLKKCHHEGLLLQRAITSHEPCLFRADALPCFVRHSTQNYIDFYFELQINVCFHMNLSELCPLKWIYKCLTTARFHADLQAQVVHWTHHPQVAGGCDVKLQPALLSSPQPARLQQEQVCFSGRTCKKWKRKICLDTTNNLLIIFSFAELNIKMGRVFFTSNCEWKRDNR